MSSKPKKYQTQNANWKKYDLIPDCKAELIICPKCKHEQQFWKKNRNIIPYGHITTMVNNNHIRWNTEKNRQEIRIDKYVLHSHFTDLDIGRNIRCKIDDQYVPTKDNPNLKLVYIQADRNIPYWVFDED